MLDPVVILQSRVRSFMDAVEQSAASSKGDQVTQHLASEYNRVLTDIAKEIPDLGRHLPTQISLSGHGERLGLTSAKLIDIRVGLKTIYGLLEVVHANNS